MFEIIYNPGSRSRQGEFVWQTTETVLKEKGVVYEAYRTTHKNHARELARSITGDGKEHNIIVIGGDGTLNEVLNGICEPDKITLGLIPSGSGNDFARGTGIPMEPDRALDIILDESKRSKVDYGVAVADDLQHRFLISCGCGFDSDVCKIAQESSIKRILNRIHMGKMTYTLIGLMQMLARPVFDAGYRLDGGEEVPLKQVFFMAAMNTKFEGGGFKFAPDADPTDGKLDFLTANNLGRRNLLYLIPLAHVGRHVGHRGIQITRMESVTMKHSRKVNLHTDGEVQGMYDSVQIRCGDTKLGFFLP